MTFSLVLSCAAVAGESRSVDESIEHSAPRLELAVDLAELGNTLDLEIDSLVEGIASSFEVRLSNRTSRKLQSITADVSCGCLKMLRLESQDLAHGDEALMIFGVLPTNTSFNQNCRLSAILDDGQRYEVATLRISGEVASPVRVSTHVIPIRAFESGFAELDLQPIPGVEIQWNETRLGSDQFQLKCLPDQGRVRIVPKEDMELDEEKVTLMIAISKESKEFVQSAEIQIVGESIKVSPSIAYLSDEGDDFGVVLILSALGRKVGEEEVAFHALGDSDERIFSQATVENKNGRKRSGLLQNQNS